MKVFASLDVGLLQVEVDRVRARFLVTELTASFLVSLQAAQPPLQLLLFFSKPKSLLVTPKDFSA
jgi:hypothetical protein